MNVILFSMKVITAQYLKETVVTRQSLAGVRLIGILGCISAVGLLFSSLVVPRFVSIWLPQFINSVWWFLQVMVGKVVYCIVDRECIAGAIFAGGYVKAALDEIEEEREFTKAERDALQTFKDNVSSMSTHSTGMGESNAMLMQTNSDSSDTLEKVRRRYRNTVMSVPGYDTIYDEGFDESFTAEFGEDLGIVVKNGSQLTPPIKQMLLKQVSTSISERQQHLDTVTTEQDSVTKAESRLSELDPLFEQTNCQKLHHCSFEDLVEHNEALERTLNKHEQILVNRQHEIHRNNQSVQRCCGGAFLQEYLYRSLETPFPVLSTILERIAAIEERRRSVIKSISRRY